MVTRDLVGYLFALTLIWSGMPPAAYGESPDAAAAPNNLFGKARSAFPGQRTDEAARQPTVNESEAKSPQVAVELRVISVPESFLEGIGVGFCPSVQQETDKNEASSVVLDDKQVFQFMQAAYANAKTNVLQAPKLTVSDGQTSAFEVGETRSFVTGVDVRWKGGEMMVIPQAEKIRLGLHVNLKTVVSADRRFVRLHFKAKQTGLDSTEVALSPVTCMLTPIFGDGTEARPVPFTQFIEQPKITTIAVDKTLSLPDGGTALIFGGKRASEDPNQAGPSITERIPYLNSLFKHSKRNGETECVLFMVTPKIGIDEEQVNVELPAH